MKSNLLAFALTTALSTLASVAYAQDEPKRTLFTNVYVFDGENDQRIENANVLVEGIGLLS